ncbi:hypothetical protein [Loigolactobacillus zhaoyuanensis]|nr:hypothetical protein [Loigolactobacillus zhaoyuanensis]
MVYFVAPRSDEEKNQGRNQNDQPPTAKVGAKPKFTANNNDKHEGE